MDLILWRHAEAEDGWPDAARALTPKGRKQAERVGRWLKERLGEEFRVLSSPAVRARQTAEGIGAPVEEVPALGTGGDPESLLCAAGWPHTEVTTVLVGHQPTLGEVAAYLMVGQPDGWAIKKGAAWWFRTREVAGRRETTLRAVIPPDLV